MFPAKPHAVIGGAFLRWLDLQCVMLGLGNVYFSEMSSSLWDPATSIESRGFSLFDPVPSSSVIECSVFYGLS